jgi:hypothetical protein
VVGRIASVVGVIAVCVVLWIHRRRHSRTVARRRHRRTVAIVVVAVDARAVIVARTRRHRDDNPGLSARSVPVEPDGLEVFEGGEAIEVVAEFVVRHDGEGVPSVDTMERDVDGDSLDAARIHSHVFLSVVVSVVRVEIQGDITPIGVVADVLHVVVDRDRAVVIHHHGL